MPALIVCRNIFRSLFFFFFFSISISRIQTMSMGEYIPALLSCLSLHAFLLSPSFGSEMVVKYDYSVCFLNLLVFVIYSIVALIALCSPSKMATLIFPSPTFSLNFLLSSQKLGHSTKKCSTVSFSYPHDVHSALSSFLKRHR